MGETGPVTGPGTKAKGQARVFVLATKKSPLMPCHPARAREILAQGRAAVTRRMPFVLRLRDRNAGITQPIQTKIDPGAKHTGLALNTKTSILSLLILTHRKEIIVKKMGQRKNYRRRRRTANLRCRQPRFNNRGKKGAIPPSLGSILGNIESWVNRLRRWAPITEIVIETTKFDGAKLQDPEISGSEYQEGTLAGYEVWEYLLQKFDHKCAYCGQGDRPLTKDHVIPKASGGSNRASNLTLACVPCNQEKGNMSVAEFLGEGSAKLKTLQAQLKKPLQGSATMNILRNKLVEKMQSQGLPITLASGAETKWNRKRFGMKKTHALDAAMAGPMTTCPKGTGIVPLLVQATGRGSYCRTRSDKFGFPRLYLPRIKNIHGFQTGDIVRTPKGVGRIAVRSSGHFALKTNGGLATVKYNQCRLLQRADGYSYSSPKQAIGVSEKKYTV